jgi:carbon monoxide dehydrogenase subunit G
MPDVARDAAIVVGNAPVPRLLPDLREPCSFRADANVGGKTAMDMTGEYRIPAPREQVWAALNDPAILKASLPGCESLERVSDREFTATVATKVGPVRAKFNGQVTLSDLHPPESYKISGEGKGGAAGFAKGGADVKLTEESAAVTVLSYTARADVGGKLAQLGSRLIDATAKKMADDFFENFRRQVSPPEAEAAPPEAVPEEGPAPVRAPQPPEGFAGLAQNKFVWAAAVIVILMIVVMLFR